MGGAKGAMLNLFWIFEHITAGPFNGAVKC